LILVGAEPSWLEVCLGIGPYTFYWDFWVLLDLVLITLLWIYIIIHMMKHPFLPHIEYIQPDTFKSFRVITKFLRGEMSILFFVTIFSCLRLLQAGRQCSRQVDLLLFMFNKIGRVLISFLFLLAYVVFFFAVIGWLLFSTEVEEFRHIFFAIVSLIRFIVTEMPTDALRNASYFGEIYNFMWNLVMLMILLNVIMAILIEAWEAVNEEDEIEKKGDGGCMNFLLMPAVCCPNCCKKWGCLEERIDPKADWLNDPTEWRRVYPAGCPERRLKDYLGNQLDLDDKDCDEVMDLIDKDNSGTVDWDELTEDLKNLKPNIENKSFVMKRRQTDQILEGQNKVASSVDQLVEDFTQNDDHLRRSLEQITDLLEQLRN